MDLLAPSLTALALLIAGTLMGIWPVKKLIAVQEAKHELKHGSAGFLRSLSGWSIIAFWLMSLWFGGTILGDWAVSGDLDGALDRAWLRLRILIEIAIAIAESDG